MSSRVGGWWGGEQLREFWVLSPEGRTRASGKVEVPCQLFAGRW